MQLDRYLVHLFQDHGFSSSGLAIGHSPIAIVRHDLVTPSSVLLAPLVSSPCPDANGGIGPLAIRLPNWLTLQLPQTNQTWKEESMRSR